MADERLVTTCWTRRPRSTVWPAAMRVRSADHGGSILLPVKLGAGQDSRRRVEVRLLADTLLRRFDQPCGDGEGSLACRPAVSSERAMRSTSAKGYRRTVHLRRYARSARQPSRGLPTEAHAYVGKRERSVGEPQRNRTDGEADALPRIGLLPSSRHGSTTGCRERFGVALSSVGGDLIAHVDADGTRASLSGRRLPLVRDQHGS